MEDVIIFTCSSCGLEFMIASNALDEAEDDDLSCPACEEPVTIDEDDNQWSNGRDDEEDEVNDDGRPPDDWGGAGGDAVGVTESREG